MSTLTEDVHHVRIGCLARDGQTIAALAAKAARDASLNPEVVLANMHGNFTGVSATIANLSEYHARRFDTAVFGQELPTSVRRFGWLEMARLLWQRPAGRRVRIWHARRNPEMWLGLFLKYVLRSPLKLVFTTVALRRHSRVPRALISAMDAIIATTPEAASLVPRCDAIVPHGVDTSVFVPPDDKQRAWQETGLPGRFGIGTFGRVRPEKGTDLFVEAMCRVLPRFPEFTAIVAGCCKSPDRPFQAALVRRIASAGLSERVIWLGEIPACERHLWFQRISLCVAAPRYEGFGLTPLEAMSCGAAAVATRTGIFPTLIEDGQTGYVVDIDDGDALADRIAPACKIPRRYWKWAGAAGAMSRPSTTSVSRPPGSNVFTRGFSTASCKGREKQPSPAAVNRCRKTALVFLHPCSCHLREASGARQEVFRPNRTRIRCAASSFTHLACKERCRNEEAFVSQNEPIIVEEFSESNRLYIFFGGIRSGIAMPPFEFYNAAKILSENKIFVRDFKQCWYHAGLPGIGSNVHSTREYLAREIERLSPEQVVFVGNSMGGFAAILFANLIGTGRAVAFAPQTFVSRQLRRLHRDRRWRKKIRRLYFRSIFRPKMFDLRQVLNACPTRVPVAIYYSDDEQLDRAHALHLRDLDNVTLHQINGGGHGVVKVLRDDGRLPAILSSGSA